MFIAYSKESIDFVFKCTYWGLLDIRQYKIYIYKLMRMKYSVTNEDSRNRKEIARNSER